MKKRFTKTNIISAAAVSLFACFTVFFFSPEEMFLANPIDYHYGIKEILLPMLLLAAAAFAVLFLFFLVLLCIHENLFHTVKCLVFGFVIAGYVQMLFLNGKMVQFNGTFYEYDSTDPFIIADWFIFYVLLFTPVILFACTKAKKKPKFAAHLSPKIIPVICGICCIMQTAGFLPGLFRAQELLRGQDSSRESYLSYAPLMSLSDEQNIVIFLTDRLDGELAAETLEKYPELNDILSGFTFYPNNISRNQNTFPTVPEMLSGLDYRGELWEDFIGQVWTQNRLLPKLHEDGWQVNLILDGNTTYATIPRLTGIADNIAESQLHGHVNYLGQGGIIPTQLRFSLIKLMPYFLKSTLYTDIAPQFANSFTVIEKENFLPDRLPKTVSADSDMQFYQYLQDNGLRADNPKKTFSFVHLVGTHDESKLLETLYPEDDPDTTSLTETARGEFVILDYYLQEMKRAGVFDCSDIVILSDHSYDPGEEANTTGRLTDKQLSALWIKPAHAPDAPMQSDPEAEMSDVYLPASILEYAGIDHTELGISFRDVTEGQMHPDRYYYFYNFSGLFANPSLNAVYRVHGDARDFSNWELLGTERPE